MLAKRFDPMVVTPLGNARLVRSAGISRIEELDWWDEATASPLPIPLTPAHHFSARTLRSQPRVVGRLRAEGGSAAYYFAGDTAYGPFFRRDPRGSARSIWR